MALHLIGWHVGDFGGGWEDTRQFCLLQALAAVEGSPSCKAAVCAPRFLVVLYTSQAWLQARTLWEAPTQRLCAVSRVVTDWCVLTYSVQQLTGVGAIRLRVDSQRLL